MTTSAHGVRSDELGEPLADVLSTVFAYARTSTAAQSVSAQAAAIRRSLGGEPRRWFVEKASGADRDRAALAEAIDYCRPGDTLVAYSIDRVARSLPHLFEVVDHLTGAGITVEFTSQALSFAPEGGDATSRLMLGLLGAVAEFERSLIRSRVLDGVARARERGAYRGRKPVAVQALADRARPMLDQGVPLARVARDLGVSRGSLYRALHDPIEAWS